MHFNYYRLEMSEGGIEIEKQEEGRGKKPGCPFHLLCGLSSPRI